MHAASGNFVMVIVFQDLTPSHVFLHVHIVLLAVNITHPIEERPQKVT